jgi:hypothetical protein
MMKHIANEGNRPAMSGRLPDNYQTRPYSI